MSDTESKMESICQLLHESGRSHLTAEAIFSMIEYITDGNYTADDYARAVEVALCEWDL